MDSVLRDINREKSKMEDDVANLNRHYEKLRGYVYEHLKQTTVEWARLVVDHPKALALIVETSPIVDENGYASSGGHEPIRFTACRFTDSTILLDQLLHPTHSREVGGAEYHGLTVFDVVDKPRLADVWPTIQEVLENRHLIIFGADWARGALRSVLYASMLDNAFCLQNRCKEYYNQFYDLSLEAVLGYQGIDKKREQLRDSRDRVLMLVQVVRNLAAGMAKQVQESEGDTLDDLDEHPF